MDMSSHHRAHAGALTVTAEPEDNRRRRGPQPAVDAELPADAEGPGRPGASGGLAIATAVDATGRPVHRGWAPAASRHRWLEPFVLMALANGHVHGYAIVGALTEVGISGGSADVGQVYRTLRDLEQAGQITSTWATGSGPARRDYQVTELGSAALDEWAAVMKERARLIAEFDAAYLSWVFDHPNS
jgi:poly-beta-hydroxybutyrate-responsive repressor